MRPSPASPPSSAADPLPPAGSDPTPSARAARDAVAAAYDTVAEDYATWLPDTRAESPLDLALLDHFLTEVATGGGGPVLDAGCGAGRMSRYLADRGCAVEGVDLSPGMVAAARRQHPDLRFAVAALDDLPFGDGTFAGVVLWYSTIHTPPADHGPLLAEAARVLRPGGFLLVAFQSGRGVRDVAPAYRGFGHEIVLERHLTTADDLTARAGAVGFGERARTVRAARGAERDPQAVVLLRLAGPTGGAAGG